jgi:hypothetical protein
MGKGEKLGLAALGLAGVLGGREVIMGHSKKIAQEITDHTTITSSPDMRPATTDSKIGKAAKKSDTKKPYEVKTVGDVKNIFDDLIPGTKE